jgi:hypothetical protein
MELVEWTESAGPSIFDYSSLEPKVSSQARASASRIKEHLRKQHAPFIDVGRELLAIKDQLGDSSFCHWLAAEFQISDHTAQRYMSAASVFGDQTDIVSILPQTALVELAAPSTPEHVRADLVRRITTGEQIHPIAIIAKIKEARDAERRAKEEGERAARLAKMTAEERAADERKRDRQRRSAEHRVKDCQRWELEQNARDLKAHSAADQAVELLKSRLAEDELFHLAELMHAAGYRFERRLLDAKTP